jgi:regulator of replication initiation timing
MFKTFSVKEVMEENNKLKRETESLLESLRDFVEETQKLQMENYNLRGENSFLKQRNKELRQKTWYEVFEENLKLAEEIKQYQAVLESVEKICGEVLQ